MTQNVTSSAGNLLAGQAPTTNGGGNFKTEECGGISFLTDGGIGSFNTGNGLLASCGTGAGISLTYALPVSPTGYDLTSAQWAQVVAVAAAACDREEQVDLGWGKHRYETRRAHEVKKLNRYSAVINAIPVPLVD